MLGLEDSSRNSYDTQASGSYDGSNFENDNSLKEVQEFLPINFHSRRV